MPRLPRLVLPGIRHHLTQRGNYRQKTYFRAEDYRLYLQLLKDDSRHFGVALVMLTSSRCHSARIPSRARLAGFIPNTPARSTCGCGA
jgi:putative transposase